MKELSKEIFVFLVVMVLVSALFLAIVAQFDYVLSDLQCNKLAEKTGFTTDYALFQGCMVEVDGQWIPKRDMRGKW